jgi:hypothetical protein
MEDKGITPNGIKKNESNYSKSNGSPIARSTPF